MRIYSFNVGEVEVEDKMSPSNGMDPFLFH